MTTIIPCVVPELVAKRLSVLAKAKKMTPAELAAQALNEFAGSSDARRAIRAHRRGASLADLGWIDDVPKLPNSGYTPQEAGGVLDESFTIAVRPGLHCSPYAHKAIGTFPDGAIRVSPGHFNTDAELATLLDALQQLAA